MIRNQNSLCGPKIEIVEPVPTATTLPQLNAAPSVMEYVQFPVVQPTNEGISVVQANLKKLLQTAIDDIPEIKSGKLSISVSCGLLPVVQFVISANNE